MTFPGRLSPDGQSRGGFTSGLKKDEILRLISFADGIPTEGMSCGILM
jgi:hypothetical protein